jgi:nitroreductase
MDASTVSRSVDPTAVLEGLLAQRHSCRGFRPDPVPQATIDRMTGIAQRTASWCNAQPWQAAITRGGATERLRAALAAALAQPAAPDFDWPREYRGAYQQRRRECGQQLYEALGIARDDKEGAARQARENFRFFGAPHVAIIHTDEALGVYGAVDCGAYVANFMLAAQSLGVASIAQAALARQPQVIREFFGLAPERRIVCGISFGYEDTAHPANGFRTSRAPLEDAITWAD